MALIGGCIATLSGVVNLGPLPLLFFAPVAALYLLGVVGVRAVASHPACA